jgi:hypothetical protein
MLGIAGPTRHPTRGEPTQREHPTPKLPNHVSHEEELLERLPVPRRPGARWQRLRRRSGGSATAIVGGTSKVSSVAPGYSTRCSGTRKDSKPHASACCATRITASGWVPYAAVLYKIANFIARAPSPSVQRRSKVAYSGNGVGRVRDPAPARKRPRSGWFGWGGRRVLRSLG